MNQKGRLDSLSNFSKYISNIDINNKIVAISEDINKAVKHYITDVKNQKFPNEKEQY